MRPPGSSGQPVLDRLFQCQQPCRQLCGEGFVTYVTFCFRTYKTTVGTASLLRQMYSIESSRDSECETRCRTASDPI
jgi:hypothetical protein